MAEMYKQWAYSKVLNVKVTKWVWSQTLEKLEGQMKEFSCYFAQRRDLLGVLSNMVKRGRVKSLVS